MGTGSSARSAVGFGAVQDGVNVERAGRVFDEADAVVADAQAQLARCCLASFLMSPSPVRAKRSSAVRMRMAVSRSMRRTSARAGGVKMIFFTPGPVRVGGLRG